MLKNGGGSDSEQLKSNDGLQESNENLFKKKWIDWKERRLTTRALRLLRKGTNGRNQQHRPHQLRPLLSLLLHNLSPHLFQNPICQILALLILQKYSRLKDSPVG